MKNEGRPAVSLHVNRAKSSKKTDCIPALTKTKNVVLWKWAIFSESTHYSMWYKNVNKAVFV